MTGRPLPKKYSYFEYLEKYAPQKAKGAKTPLGWQVPRCNCGCHDFDWVICRCNPWRIQ